MLNGRNIQPELLEGLPPESAARNLTDLVRINRWFGGRRIARQVFGELFETQDSFTVLDCGAASGDMAVAIARAFPRAEVVSCDLDDSHLAAAPFPKLAADAFHLPFADGTFDVVYSSLFLHHFDDTAVRRLLEEFARVARRAVVAVDLERSAISRAFLPATRAVFGWDPVTVSDGSTSVGAAFKPRELRALAGGFRGARVRRHMPWFRLSLVIPLLHDRRAL